MTTFITVMSAVMLAGCQTSKEVEGLTWSTGTLEWTAEKRAGQRIGARAPSPLITLSGPLPAGTATMRASMRDLQNAGWDHGGGTIDPTAVRGGVIPEGAIKGSYYGPAGGTYRPDLNNEYEFRIYALGADQVVIGKWLVSKRCCADMGF